MESMGGNAEYDRDSTPFLFDPASYYGDREADLAFTYMFGGFSSAFMMPEKNTQSTLDFVSEKPFISRIEPL